MLKIANSALAVDKLQPATLVANSGRRYVLKENNSI